MAHNRTGIRSNTGFTLIELVIVIILVGIMSILMVMIIRGPLESYVQVERRVVLTDIMQTAMQRMTREIRLALPFSVRVGTPGGNQVVEFFRTLDGGRYRNQGANRLKFNQTSGTFEVFNPLINYANIDTASSGTPYQECMNSTADCLVVYNINQPSSSATAALIGKSANAYLGASNAYEGNIAAITAAGVYSISFDNSTLMWDFGLESPQQRFHIVDTPVSYVCNGSQIYRYSDYAISENIQASPGGSQNLLIDNITACSFSYIQPSLTKFGILTIRIQVADSVSGESVYLSQQIHVTNIP